MATISHSGARAGRLVIWQALALCSLLACGDGDSAGRDGGDTEPDGGGTESDGGGTEGDGGGMDGGESELPPEEPPPQVTVQTPTFHSIGLIWDLGGDDADHDAVLSVRYRKASEAFSTGMPLIRSDALNSSGETQNDFAGSLMFLTPGTRYLIELSYDDPDDADAEDGNVYTFTAETRPIPVKPTGGNTYYVVPGSGSDNAGTASDPFEGIAEANANATPGDTFLLGSGTYTDATLDVSGEEGEYIVYTEDPDDPGAVVHSFAIAADHIWIDGLTFAWDGSGTEWQDTSALRVPFASPALAPDDVVITDNTVSDSGFESGIYNPYGGSRWVITDNTFIGGYPVGIGDTGTPGDSEYRSCLCSGDGNVFAYNSTTRFDDGLNIGTNTDTYGNQIWDHQDDLVSTDGGGRNVRVWGNRLHAVAGYATTYQPQAAGPWYYLYNQIADASPFKWRWSDRIVFVGNTFIGANNRAQNWLRCFSRNNLFIAGSPVWLARDTGSAFERPPQWEPDWNTDLDHDGFDRGDGGGALVRWYDDDGQTDPARQAPQPRTDYDSIAAFAAALGVEDSGVEVDRDLIFADYRIDAFHSLELAPGTNDAVDTGGIVPNIADFHEGSAPDLGAHERGAAPSHYGPRDTTRALRDRTEHWTKH